MTQQTNRRVFLQKTTKVAAATVAMTSLGAVHTQAAAAESKLGIGIIGCGGIMTHHVTGLVG
ncbi:MAG: gfo/Idh/MocA family oxidoreductase, partial [Pirellulaceae bacterium]